MAFWVKLSYGFWSLFSQDIDLASHIAEIWAEIARLASSNLHVLKTFRRSNEEIKVWQT